MKIFTPSFCEQIINTFISEAFPYKQEIIEILDETITDDEHAVIVPKNKTLAQDKVGLIEGRQMLTLTSRIDR